MKRNKVLGKAAMVISAVLLIGAGGAAFAAANENMLSGEIGKIIEVAANNTLPPAVPTAEPDAASTGAEPTGTESTYALPGAPDFTSADYTVNESYEYTDGIPGTPELPETALTAREAADIAAEYLWRVFGYSSKGKNYDLYPESAAFNFSASGQPYNDVSDMFSPVERLAWNGYLAGEAGEVCAVLSVDAITGEIISAKVQDITIPEEPVAMRDYLSRESVDAWNSRREEFLDLAKSFAEKHFQSKVASAEFESTTAVGIAMWDQEERTTVNEAGKEVPLVTHHLYEISVKDENGKEIIVSVTDNTKELYEIYSTDTMLPENRELNAQVQAEMGYK